MKREVISIKKVSLCSLDNYGLTPTKLKEEKVDDVAPKDRFFFVHILFLLMGLMHFIPFTFFVTANAYWMYKFRDVNKDIMDTDARTILQTHFSPANSIMNNIFSPVTVLLSTFYGYKIKARVRVLTMLSGMSLCFIAGTTFVKMDTDSWQLTFFVITVIILGIISTANVAFGAGNFTILSRFPPYYMKVYLMGQGLGGISSSILQLLSLAMGTSTEVSALFYFVSGSSLMTLTLFMFYMSKYNKLYNYHFNSMAEDFTKEVIPLSEVKALAKKIWAPTLTSVLWLLTISPVMPHIVSLVVSENYGSGSQWTDKYFVPTVSFLYSDALSLIGRGLCAKSNKIFTGAPICIFMGIRLIILVPLVYLCNAHPRHFLPVVFKHDWEYILILGAFAFTNGYLINMAYMDVPNKVPPEKIEDAYMVMVSLVSLSNILFVPIGMFSVDIL